MDAKNAVLQKLDAELSSKEFSIDDQIGIAMMLGVLAFNRLLDEKGILARGKLINVATDLFRSKLQQYAKRASAK